MNRAIRILTAAAVLALTVPGAALACDDDRLPAPRPATHEARWRHDDVRWERRAELRALRGEYARLEREREAFHARWHGRPGKIRKYERWYAAELARLDARWAELTRAYAYRF